MIHVRKSCRKRRVRQCLKSDRTKLIKRRTIAQSQEKALIIHQIFIWTFVRQITKEIGAASKKDKWRQMMNIS